MSAPSRGPGFSPALIAYRLLTRMIEPLAPRLLDARVKQGKEDAGRVDERLGVTRIPRPPGDLIWLHGVSVGETLSLLPLIERLRQVRPDLSVLVTSNTLTSAALLADRLPGLSGGTGVVHQFSPIDGPAAVTAFLDHWRPSLGVFVESELWPNLLTMARARGIRLALVSARVTDRTVTGWRRFPGAIRRILSTFDLLMPQDAASAALFQSLGGQVDGLVNLKLSGTPLPHDSAAFSRLSAAIGDRLVVVAASTHEGEEVALAKALRTGALKALPTRTCLILIPRHPARGPAIAADLTREGYRFALRSRGVALGPDTDLYVADTLGELGLFLRLADVVIMGGSFGPLLNQPPVGGHNPLEPARLARAVVAGPDAANWQAVTQALADAGGLTIVHDLAQLPAVLAPLLADPAAARAMGERARRAATEAGAGLDDLWARLQPLLPPVLRSR